MRMVYVNDLKEEMEFAHRAAEVFAKDPQIATYTDDGGLTPGSYLAIRWGLGNDCVVVAKLDDYHQPTNYQQLITHCKEEQ